MERLTSVQTIEHTDGTSHEQIYCFGHLWGPAFFKKGTKDYEEYLSIVKRLAEYEDLEEQGKLLKLPCALGDTVYCIMTSIKGTNPVVFSQKFDYCMIEYFGRTVFLTRGEAEAALKGLEKG